MALSFDNFTEEQQFIFSIIVGTACIIATVFRLLSTRHAGRKIGLEDWFALAALLAYLVYTVLELISIGLVAGKDVATLPDEELTRLGKVLFATVPFYPLNQFFAKFSILALYHRIFSVRRVFVRWIYLLGAIQLVDSIITLFINLFSCTPISYNWDFSEDGWCLDQAAVFTGTETVNSTIDLAMVILACFMIVDLQLDVWTKLKLSIIFVLGGLSGVIGFIRISQFYVIQNEVGVFSATNGFWENAQQATSIICCCIPVYKNIFPFGAFYTRLVSSFGSDSWRRDSRRHFRSVGNPSDTFGSGEQFRKAWTNEMGDFEPQDLSYDKSSRNPTATERGVDNKEGVPAMRGYTLETIDIEQTADKI
ncbi:hypothetical protein F4859DRAFT_485130 [Xylaria cf. heliscus]|nr:hypothetical protein F4859DRAFT_485130 [Xylaria cf. heliscus]